MDPSSIKTTNESGDQGGNLATTEESSSKSSNGRGEGEDSPADTTGKRTSASTFRSQRAKRNRTGASSDRDDDDDDDYLVGGGLDQVIGAVPVPGASRSAAAGVDGSEDGAAVVDNDDHDVEEQQTSVNVEERPIPMSNDDGLLSNARDSRSSNQYAVDTTHDRDDDEEGGLVKAELAPTVYDATHVQLVDPNKEKSVNDGSQRRRTMLLLAVVLVVVAAIGIGLGVGLRNDSESPSNTDTNSNDTSTLVPGSTDPYAEAVAFRGRNEDWVCSLEGNSVEFLGSETDDYSCLFQVPNRPSFPFADYNTFLYCECPGGPVSELNPPTNDKCDCVVWFTDHNAPCLWTHFVETNETEFFQITFDCFNVFADALGGAASDKNCVGRDPEGNCITNNDKARPPVPAIQTGNAQDLTCLNTTADTQAGIFSVLRGRYQCNSHIGMPFPDTFVTTSLFCTEQGGYFDENDCNCAIFLFTRSLEFACEYCEVIPNGSNDTYELAYDCSGWFDGDCIGYDVNQTCIDAADRPEVCTYYEIQSCRKKALELGLWLGGAGFAFSGDYDTKGCYFYQGDHPVYGNRAYFGVGEYSKLQLETTPVGGNYRLECDTVLDDPPATQVCEVLDATSCRAIAESRGPSVGNEAYPFVSANYIPGCYYYPDSSDPSLANTAFFGTLRDDPLQIFQIPINGPNRFFCNATAVMDFSNLTEFVNASGGSTP